MKHALIALVGFALAFAQEGWEVAGVVTYNAKPLKGSLVQARGPGQVKGVLSDAQGHYSLKGATPGQYTITAGNDYDEYVARSVSLSAAAHVKLDIAVAAGGVISGRVLDAGKHPISRMTVQAFLKTVTSFRVEYDSHDEAGSNDRGEYRLTHLPPGQYVIAVSARPPKLQKGQAAVPSTAYPVATFYSGTPLINAAALVEVRSGEEQSAIDIVLAKQPAHCVSFQLGGIFPAANEPQMISSFAYLELPSFVASGVDNVIQGGVVKGPNRLCGLAPGEYRLSFVSQRRYDVTTPYRSIPVGYASFNTQGYLAVPFVIEREDKNLGPLEVAAPSELHGKVSVQGASSDDPVPDGIRVGIVPKEEQVLGLDDHASARVTRDGTLDVLNVFPADYAVGVAGLPAGYYVIDARQQGRSVRDGGLRAGGGDLVVILAKDGAAVSGRVLAEDGSAIPDASVLLSPMSAGRPRVVQSDQDGIYRFTFGVPPGDYRIAAVAKLPQSLREDTAAIAKLVARGTDLSLGPRETLSVDLKIR